MTIIPVTSAAPVRSQAAVDGLDDVIAEAFSVFGEVQDLSKLGFQAAVTIAPGSITADVTVSREAVGLLPDMVRELEHAGITYTPTGLRVAGAMCQSNVVVQFSVDLAFLAPADLEAIAAAVDLNWPEFEAARAAWGKARAAAAAVALEFRAAHDRDGWEATDFEVHQNLLLSVERATDGVKPAGKNR